MKKLIWALGFLVIFAGTATASTADGLTPAEETVCDGAGLTGALWGLCNAYCEAMDCDSGAPKASLEACRKTAAAESPVLEGCRSMLEEAKEVDLTELQKWRTEMTRLRAAK